MKIVDTREKSFIDKFWVTQRKEATIIKAKVGKELLRMSFPACAHMSGSRENAAV
jgi:hypothetical protein